MPKVKTKRLNLQFEWRNVLLALVISLAIGTILTIVFGQLGGNTLELGKAWFIVFITIFIAYFFFAAEDKRIDKNEIVVMLFIAAMFFIIGYVMNRFIPELFTSLPKALQNLYSALGV